MPTLYMLVGVPASGKSTWINSYISHQKRFLVLSTDNYIQAVAELEKKTYNEAFSAHIKKATKLMYQSAAYAFENDIDVVWDQTNLTVRSRGKKLEMVPDHYKKFAIYFSIPSDVEHKRRLDARPGKSIPAHILKNMIESVQIPSEEEGFDEVLIYESEQNEVRIPDNQPLG